MIKVRVRINKPDLVIERDGQSLVMYRHGIIHKRHKVKKVLSVHASSLTRASKWRRIWAVLRGRIFGFVIKSHDVVTLHRIKTGALVEECRVEVPEEWGKDWGWVAEYDKKANRTNVIVYRNQEEMMTIKEFVKDRQEYIDHMKDASVSQLARGPVLSRALDPDCL